MGDQTVLTQSAKNQMAYWLGWTKGTDAKAAVDALDGGVSANFWYEMGLLGHPVEEGLKKMSEAIFTDAFLAALAGLLGAALAEAIKDALGKK